MNQGTFFHDANPITIPAIAAQTGDHILAVSIPGGAVLRETFSATLSTAFSIPNIFPEVGTFSFRVIQPDGTDFDDGSGCSMSLSIQLVSCSPA